MKEILNLLSEAGTKKLTLVGGEPTLCPYLGQILIEIKSLGITSMIVSNGTGISEAFFSQYAGAIDWIGLSIDSPSEETQFELGRGTGKHVSQTKEKAQLIQTSDICLKINTVITLLNLHQDFHQLINQLQPDRWKVFQVLPIEGQNNEYISQLEVTKEEFSYFLYRHQDLTPIGESNDDMKGSYLMIDPIGRFFQNTNNNLVFSDPILEVGIFKAINQVGWNSMKFQKRKGLYPW